MKQLLLKAMRCSLGFDLYDDSPADQVIDGSNPKHTARDITDALVNKARSGDTAAAELILKIADFEPTEGK